MAKEQDKKKKERRPQALKRDLQNDRRRLRNRTRKSRVKTVIRSFQESLPKGDEALTQEALNAAYSIVDKCVKTGVYKANKGNRLKARLAARAAKA